MAKYEVSIEFGFNEIVEALSEEEAINKVLDSEIDADLKSKINYHFINNSSAVELTEDDDE